MLPPDNKRFPCKPKRLETGNLMKINLPQLHTSHTPVVTSANQTFYWC